ncbi:RDD family protein [Gemella sp. GH3]|uniref:RDD family protein n=1 Tax=unclassified Gemella TaxID=2624949 RepID=UPI0015D03E43|nr:MULTISPECIES: RDD family protein [unclassified Gemella]MBF0713684.1 RDD family protein [Gemella sp. GH3.1]NYS50636.1 RDD family protein [Gemella sp. GH3]
MTNKVDNNFSFENIDIEENIEIETNNKNNSSGVVAATIDDYVKISKNFYAGFWIRIFAFIIDCIIIFCLGTILNTITFGLLDIHLPYNISDQTLIFVLTYYLYFLLMTYILSQTLGKMIIGVKVEKNVGGKLSFIDAFFREVIGRYITITLLFLPFLSVIFTSKKKALHDYIADSVVVKEDFSNFRMKLNKAIKEIKQ